MTLHPLDHRRVQTAVIGDKNSDHPVILPMDADELDRWRKAHPAYTYWCGIQLGGCGGELTDRRYTDKVCHFAHHPNAVCYRTANGDSSADHLFIKRGLQRLLDKQGLRGKVKTSSLGTGPGDAVDVHLPGTRRRLRFQLTTIDYRAWRRTADELTKDADGIDWILASDGPITQELLGRYGYSLRVRCETAGGERHVHIGTASRDRALSWTPLAECALTSSGLTTPDVETIRISRPHPKPAGFPIQGGLVFALVPETAAPASSAFVAEDRHLLVADVKPVDSPIVRALVSLPADTDVPPTEHVYRVPDTARLLVTEHGKGWAVEVNRYIRLNAHEAQRTGLWTPPAMLPSAAAPPPAPVRRSQSRPESASPPKPEPTRQVVIPTSDAAAVPVSRTHGEMVTALRDALTVHARLRSTTTWGTLARTVGLDLSALSEADCGDLLVELDRPIREHAPVLSALIRQDEQQLPYLGEVLTRLGLDWAASSPHLKRWAAHETERAFAAYADPPRVMQPRLSLAPTHRIPEPRRSTTQSHRKTSVPESTVSKSVERLRELIRQLEELRPQLSKPVRQRVKRATQGAEHWLATQAGRRRPAVKSATIAAQGPHYIRSLEKALEDSRTDIKQTEWLARFDESKRQKKEPPKSAPKQPDPQPNVTRQSHEE